MDKLYDLIINLETDKSDIGKKYNPILIKKLNQLYKKINLKKGPEPYSILRLYCSNNHNIYFKWTYRWILLKSCSCSS